MSMSKREALYREGRSTLSEGASTLSEAASTFSEESSTLAATLKGSLYSTVSAAAAPSATGAALSRRP